MPTSPPGLTQLPPNCGSSAAPCVTAVAPGTYPLVFNNDGVDTSFGVTQPIVLDEINPSNDSQIASLTVPNSTQPGVTPGSDQMVTSFSSKSEIALNLSTDGRYVTFMGYNAPVGAMDVSNANTPGDIDPTSGRPRRLLPGRGPAGREQQLPVHRDQRLQRQQRSGGHPREPATNTIYAAGNGGNGANPEPQGVVTGPGAQILSALNPARVRPDPGPSPRRSETSTCCNSATRRTSWPRTTTSGA